METQEKHPVISEFEKRARRMMLKYHVGQIMFCPACDAILDFRRAVELDFYRNGKLAASKIFCASCYDAKIAQNVPAVSEQTKTTVTITDGRTF